MTAYSFWEQGRDMATGQIVSMTPFSPNSGGKFLGGMPLGGAGMMLSAIAQFGVYLEARQMRRINESAFEERRHAWIDDITNQWIAEHESATGIQRQITNAVSIECSKMWESLCANEKVDVPQSLLLRVARMTEFLEWNYFLVASATNSLVDASNSANNWRLDPFLRTLDFAEEVMAEAVKETKGDWWKGLLKVVGGVPLLIIPGVGPFAGGGAIGYGAVEMIQCLRASDADVSSLRDKFPLLQFGVAADLLDRSTRVLEHLLEQQKFKEPTCLVCHEVEVGRIDFLLQAIKKPGWFRKPKFDLIPVIHPDSTP